MIQRLRMEDATPIYSPMDPHVALDNEHCEDKPVDKTLYLRIVGSWMFAALGTRRDIAFNVTALSTYKYTLPLQMHDCSQANPALPGNYGKPKAIPPC